MSETPRSIALGTIAVLTLSLCACEGAGSTEHRATHDESGAAKRSVDASPDGTSEKTISIPTLSGQEDPSIANPADEHCVEAGYRLEYIRENGIPVDGLCINDETGAKCQSWAYFRKECTLDSAARPKERTYPSSNGNFLP